MVEPINPGFPDPSMSPSTVGLERRVEVLERFLQGITLNRITGGSRGDGTAVVLEVLSRYAGLASSADGRYRVQVNSSGVLSVALGGVAYREVRPPNDGFEERPPKFVTPKIPTLGGVPISATPPPTTTVKAGSWSVWLVCQQDLCSGNIGGDEPERIMVAKSGAQPAISEGEIAILLWTGVLATSPNGLVLESETRYFESDWIQDYLCECCEEGQGGFGDDTDTDGDGTPDSDDDDDDNDGIPDDSDPDPDGDGIPGGGNGSAGSGGSATESDEDDGGGSGCTMRVTAGWVNQDALPSHLEGGVVTRCFPDKGTCEADTFTFRIRTRFELSGGIPRDCQSWAFGVRVEGSYTPEQVWSNDGDRTNSFILEDPPTCGGEIVIHWRALGHPPSGTVGSPKPCCTSYSGTVKIKVPQSVCNCDCSSSNL